MVVGGGGYVGVCRCVLENRKVSVRRKKLCSQVVMVHTLIPAFERQRQADL